jgi:hypothetical protein
MSERICKGCGAKQADDGTTTYDGPPKPDDKPAEPLAPAPSATTSTTSSAAPPAPAAAPVREEIKVHMLEYL